ncbi:phosphatase PAP2 family protein [Bradyrhizobium japonicum]|uniref:Phosphatidic acid phosphatase type 2/haloperoxidase domain-containing protein n=1 Tax=Bradyrhizobium japonicum TaxID=375 RepID=A0ABV2S120_BRAJP|nr:phosphatase PAP2 family protein [Bradyrhizobium japonicum]MBR0749703.1 phosphatase PAP2 family protein [Bradyrhizobium japonicum]MCS3501844.1 undecaprenyl-diphosphatase [Bradyrhizobium japonicum]MCS3965442.1 undecaprenyl-diphosphatase [Bradyrhizobium japonicum]MCS3997749.1 undecaprenyl-diphosphatase [Bradyrhizobium japonicum]UQD76110.1 phosphatase PAP2 family protein [Bradyrhizobium japonicum]
MTIRVHPLSADIELARAIAHHSRPLPERISGALTWGADEHTLTALAVGWWVWCRAKPPSQRLASDHVLLTTLASVLLPHILKRHFDQVRPDRRTVRGHLHGVPLSGRALDAFPSGHAVHIGALASAAAVLPPAKRNLAWGLGAVLVSTRVFLLAHWASDVLAGLAIGAALERIIRLLTGFGRRGSA